MDHTAAATVSDKRRVVVIGVDGATLDIITPMLNKGLLPNFARLIESGSHGVLNSVVPDLSPAAWTSFMTGKHPGKHGVIDFFGQSPGSYHPVFFNAAYRKAKPIWSLLSDVGKKVCVVNVPLTYPPDKVNGIMVSGMDTPSIESDFVYPLSFREELDKCTGGYILEKAERNVGKNIENYMQSLLRVNNIRFQAAKHLISKDDWDFFMIVFESTDRVQHNFWKFMDSEHPEYNHEVNQKYGNLIYDTYCDIDTKLGELTAEFPDDTILIIMSDHGCGPLYKGVRLTQWLQAQNYLKMKESSLIEIYKILVKEKIKSLIKGGPLRKLLKFRTLKLPKGDASGILDHIQMGKTRIYPMGGYSNLCINLKGRQPLGIVEPGSEYESLRDEIISKLKKLKDPSNGKPVISNIWKREEIYDQFPENVPDILISWASGYSAVGEKELALLGIHPKKNTIFTKHRWSGNHLPNGVLFLKGEPIKKNYRLNHADIVDITPTILALLSVSIPDDMDGKPLTEVLTDSFLGKTPINWRKAETVKAEDDHPENFYTTEESHLIEQRLRDLGYME
jgi:predicted AlkP superfamily phosphohydrolase/phosphomutase